MIKGQDVVLLLKLIANKDSPKWPQSKLAEHLCMSVSTVNASLKRLHDSRLIIWVYPTTNGKFCVYKDNAYEFLTCSVKYFFYEEMLSGMTCGIVTGYAATMFRTNIGKDPVPVWPYAEGNVRGIAFKPLYPSVPKSVSKYKDTTFYDLLCLTDTLRSKLSNIREERLAKELLKTLILEQNDNKLTL